MGDYHDYYLKSDVLLFPIIFEKFRNMPLWYYGLDPYQYFSSHGLSLDAMLEMKEVNLGLIVDADIYKFIEKGIRGGVSSFLYNSKIR